MNCLGKILSNIGVPVRGVRGLCLFGKQLSFTLFFSFLFYSANAFTGESIINETDIVSTVGHLTILKKNNEVVKTTNFALVATISSPSSVCQGGSATVTIQASGGTAPYTIIYNINGGGLQFATTDLSGTSLISVNTITATTFTYNLLTVADGSTSNPVPGSTTIIINPKPVFQTISPSTPTICYGASFFNVTLTYSNSPTEYKLDWSPSAITDGFTNVAYASNNFTSGVPLTIAVPTATAQVTTYTGTLTVRNAITGCESDPGTAPFQINALPTPGITTSGPLTFCTGNSVDLTGTGGTSYAWSNGTNVALTNITTGGTYSVTVTNAAGCSAATSTTVTVNALPTPTINASGPLTFCTGGSVTLTGGGGTSYAWSNGSVVAATNITTSGTYTVTVTDVNSCQNITSTVVIVNALPTPIINASGPLTFCTGGSVTLTGGGGTSYAWSNGSVVAATNITTSGTYTVTVTDVNSCQNITSTVVTVNPLPTPTINASGPLTFCTGGSVTLTGGGGTSYAWSNGSVVAATNITTSGTYTVTVTDVNSCQNITSTVVTVNALPTPTINASGPLTFCTGGSVTLTGGGGTSYAWSNGSVVAATNITTSGTYTVTVTDVNSCQNITSTVVIVNALPTPTINASGPLTFCTGGSVTLTGGGGTSYAWSNGSVVAATNITTSGTYTVTVTDVNGCQNITSTVVTVNALPTATITAAGPTTFCSGGSVTLNANTVTGLSYVWTGGGTLSTRTYNAGGSYSVTVTDGNGCQNTSAPTVVTVNALPAATITAAGPTTFCSGGSVTLNANTGTGLSYLWTGGGTSSTRTYNAGGSYTVTVTDGNGCQSTSAPTVVTVNALPIATITAVDPTTFCSGGSVTLNANTGTGLSYLWTGGGTLSTRTYNAGGSYSVTVTDGNGCQNTSAPTVVTVNALPAATITAAGSTTFCSGGSVTLNANTGTGLSYLWTGGGTLSSRTYNTGGIYSVTVTDGNGCQSTSAPTVVTVNALPLATITAASSTTFCSGGSVTLNANTGTGLSYLWTGGGTLSSRTYNTGGSYSVTVTDGNGCQNTSSPTVVTVNALPLATITAAGSTTFCSGGSVTLNANTGTGLSYLWTGGGTLSSRTYNTGGSYSVTVTDGNGCQNTSAPTVVTVNALPTATITALGPTTFCSGGSVNLTASGGTSYAWSGGPNTAAYNNIGATGTYSVTVTNAAGCSATTSRTVTVNPLPTATINASGPLTFCTGNSVNLSATGGGNYLWSNGSTNANISNIISSGTYTVTVTDVNNCAATSAPVTITVNALPTVSITNPAAVCAPGTVDLTAAAITNGSTAGLTYSYWSNPAGTQTLSTPFAIGIAGTYYIRGTNTVTNCAAIQPVLVTINPQASIQINTPTAVCAPGTVDITAAAITNGSAAGLSYTYFRDAAATTTLANANAVNTSGVYYIKGTPVSGCSAIVPVSVTINPLPTLVINNPAAVCSPQTINLADANITAGSSAGLSFAYFSNAALTAPIANAQALNGSGMFYIRATDAITGCFRSGAVTVQVNAAPQGVLQTPATNIICENGSLTLNATGGNSYQWLLNQQPITGANSATYNATAAGTYAVRFISAQGCSTTSSNSINLELLNKPTVQFTLTNACAGVSTSFNNTSVTGASGGINWLWDFGDGSSSNQFAPTHIYTSSGTYTVRLTATSPVCTGFNETSVVTYRVQSALPAVRYKDVDVLKDIPVTVTARAIGTSYLWLPATGVNNNRIATPSIRVNTTTEYTVAITNDIGCTTVDTILLKVIPGVDIYVPQGFTPNNDGQNDRLYPILVGMRQLNYFRVFNRWGTMIFTTKESSAQSGWNGLYLGVKQPMGTYTWMAEAVDLQGNVVRKTGTVLLLQ